MKRLTLIPATKYILALLVAFLMHSCATNPVTGKKELMLMSTDQEIAMGLQYDPSITANYGLYQDDAMQDFIQYKRN